MVGHGFVLVLFVFVLKTLLVVRYVNKVGVFPVPKAASGLPPRKSSTARERRRFVVGLSAKDRPVISNVGDRLPYPFRSNACLVGGVMKKQNENPFCSGWWASTWNLIPKTKM